MKSPHSSADSLSQGCYARPWPSLPPRCTCARNLRSASDFYDHRGIHTSAPPEPCRDAAGDNRLLHRTGGRGGWLSQRRAVLPRCSKKTAGYTRRSTSRWRAVLGNAENERTAYKPGHWVRSGTMCALFSQTPANRLTSQQTNCIISAITYL